MNKSLKAVTIGDIDGIGIKLLINLWKFKKKKDWQIYFNNKFTFI